MRNTILKWLALIALIAYTTVMSVWASGMMQQRRLNGVRLNVAHSSVMSDTITERGIIAELVRMDPKLLTRPISAVNTASIENYLMRGNVFEDVQCAITSSGKLLINVVPIIPEVRVFSGNDSWYINKNGKKIPSNANYYADVPVVCGRFSKQIQPKDLLPLVRFLQADSLYKQLFTTIKVDGPNDVLLVPRLKGHVVNIGNLHDLDRKMRKVMIAYRDVLPYRGWATYDTISVKFHGQIVATRRDKTILNHVPEYEQDVDFEEESLQQADLTDADATPGAPKAVKKPEENKPKPESPSKPDPEVDKKKTEKHP